MIPDFFKKKLIEQYGNELTDKILEGYENRRKVTFRINSLKSNVEEIKKELKQNNIEFKGIEWSKDAFILENANESEIRNLQIYEQGKIYLQSLSSMLPVIFLNPKPNENILDMAAAPGGKTTQIVSITNDEAMITACENNKIRMERLKYNLQKQGATRVNVLMQDARRLDDFFSFDKILIDAPCSGSGTYNALKGNFTEELIKKSAKRQEELLLKAVKILKKGGEIVYSTCSILKDENEKIIKQVLKKNNMEIVELDDLDGIPKLPTEIKGTVCILPNELYEGFFVAKLRK